MALEVLVVMSNVNAALASARLNFMAGNLVKKDKVPCALIRCFGKDTPT